MDAQMNYNTYVGPTQNARPQVAATNPIDDGNSFGKPIDKNNIHYHEDAILSEILDNINVQQNPKRDKEQMRQSSSIAEPTFQDNDNKQFMIQQDGGTFAAG